LSEETEQKETKGLKKYERMLKNKKKEVRIAAIKEIKELGINERKTIRLLESVLEQTVDPDEWTVKNEAIITLGIFASKHSIHHLAAHLNDPNSIVREAAAYALGQIKDKKSVMDLIGGLEDDSFSVREKSANALAKLGDIRAIDALLKKARSPDVQIRLSTIPSLYSFENDQRVINVLIETLHDKETRVRFPAIIAFNKIKSARAIDPLIENLQSDDPLLQKVSADALVFNLGWGSVADGVLTKFGERRRQVLLASEGLQTSDGSGTGGASGGKEKTFVMIAEELANFLNLDPQRQEKLKTYLADLDNFFKIAKK